MQYKEVVGGICAPKGFAAAGVHCGIRANHSEKYDLALIKAEVRCAAAGVYTTNKVCGAPIKVDRAHLADGYAQAIVVNSGNANTCAANGVALEAGFTTPDPEEAAVKAAAVRRARESWFLVDDAKFAKIYPAVITDLHGGAILTNRCPNPKYKQYTFVKEAEA